MAQLTIPQRHDRLRFDYRIAMEMRSEVMNVTAYQNADDLRERRNPIVSEADGHLATHYLADYHLKTLIGPDRYTNNISVHFDLLANGNYPYSHPSCFVISTPIPWTPHVTTNRPICTDDETWLKTRGKMLLGQWLVHVAKLLNFDEIPKTENYGGLTPEAARYWRDKLGRQPITLRFPYPVLPEWISTDPSISFDAVESDVLFEAAMSSSSDPINLEVEFQPTSSMFTAG